METAGRDAIKRGKDAIGGNPCGWHREKEGGSSRGGWRLQRESADTGKALEDAREGEKKATGVEAGILVTEKGGRIPALPFSLLSGTLTTPYPHIRRSRRG